MRWIVRFLVLYAVALVIVGVVAIVGMTSAPGDGQPSHAGMDPVSHNAYELHRSIGRVP